MARFSSMIRYIHIQPFEGANLEPAALEFTGIDPYHPLRMAETEKEALSRMFKPIRDAINHHGCNRAVLVGHNAHFDLGFLNQAIGRSGLKRAPFHPFPHVLIPRHLVGEHMVKPCSQELAMQLV